MPASPTMQDILAQQRRALARDGFPDAARRRDRLNRCIAMLIRHQNRIAEALRADFGARSALTTKASELVSSCVALRVAEQALESWMQPEERPLLPGSAGPGARAEVHYQPLGVVGVIAPWNAPFLLCFNPLASIFAAGNSAMVKPSELAPTSADLLAEIVAADFDQDELAVVTGGPDVAAAFSALPFDHLMFTGSEATARKVMRAAADNLVPVTLELGGKSPVVIGPEADIEIAALRVVHGKLLNGGQICMSPDYVLVPEEQVQAFADACQRAALALYPDIGANEHFTSMITDRHYARQRALVDDARAKGARIIEVNPEGAPIPAGGRKLPLHVLTGVSLEMNVMQEEIFGPLLPIVPYADLPAAIERINSGPRPLAVYYFGSDQSRIAAMIAQTSSGNMAINDVVAQGMREEIPYGGVGSSGMGAYKGVDGFRNFSHAKPVFFQTDVEAALQPFRPPYAPQVLGMIEGMLQSFGGKPS